MESNFSIETYIHFQNKYPYLPNLTNSVLFSTGPDTLCKFIFTQSFRLISFKIKTHTHRSVAMSWGPDCLCIDI